jgi:phage portal protein BeeE
VTWARCRNGFEEELTLMFDFLKTRGAEPAEKKASATGRVAAWSTQGRVAWTPRDTGSLTRAGFMGNPVGFRSVKLIAEAAAALPLVLQDSERRFDVHPVLGLIKRPNGAQGRAELLEALYAQLLLSGDGYLEAVGGELGLPYELHVLRSDRICGGQEASVRRW